ncbi:MAG: hypothetical protein M3N41_08110 [Acidobacteriota bacterium]|nr:hypothetical protein [Acidobacteriota bacterium]
MAARRKDKARNTPRPRPLPSREGNAFVRWTNAKTDSLASSLSADGFIQFDRYAIWFLILSLSVFGIASLADLNGSSTGFYRKFGYAPPQKPLLGEARGIRSDEWTFHTPAILNQALRPDPFAVERIVAGDHAISLVSNVPIRQVSTLFRPQFWPFFLLPLDYAFAAYWQLKGLVLIAGVFTWLLLVTQSSLASATGALWYFFSPFTQWTYSWPSLLPEMVGLLCLTLVFVCYLTVGTKRFGLLFAGAGAAACSINFILCGYLPHLIPLCWFAAFFLAGWCFVFRKSILRREALHLRLLAITGAVVLIAVVAAIVYIDLRPAIAIEAATIYPGQRRLAGGFAFSAPVLLSHFLPWSETETRFPALTGNICEAAGFLWFAPMTWLWWRPRAAPFAKNIAFLVLSMFFLFIGLWMVAPIPEQAGRFFGLNLTYGTRCLPALGLANIAIVALFLSTPRDRTAASSRSRWSIWILRCTVTLVLFTALVIAANASIQWFFSWREVLVSAGVGTLLIVLLFFGPRHGFAAVLIPLQMVMFGSVNPLERGLSAITSSELARFLESHPELRKDRWLVYSDSLAASGFLNALGCDVYTKCRYIPDVDHFALFKARGLDTDLMNRGAYFTARLIDASAPSRFELVNSSVIRWHVGVSDPLLKQLGIRYLAFDKEPPPGVTAYLMPLSAVPVGGLWLYRLL